MEQLWLGQLSILKVPFNSCYLLATAKKPFTVSAICEFCRVAQSMYIVIVDIEEAVLDLILLRKC